MLSHSQESVTTSLEMFHLDLVCLPRRRHALHVNLCNVSSREGEHQLLYQRALGIDPRTLPVRLVVVVDILGTAIKIRTPTRRKPLNGNAGVDVLHPFVLGCLLSEVL